MTMALFIERDRRKNGNKFQSIRFQFNSIFDSTIKKIDVPHCCCHQLLSKIDERIENEMKIN